jgi:hypothetical protein
MYAEPIVVINANAALKTNLDHSIPTPCHNTVANREMRHAVPCLKSRAADDLDLLIFHVNPVYVPVR